MFRILSVCPGYSVVPSENADDVRRPPSTGESGRCIRWVDLEDQDESTLHLLAERFGFHPLTIEDCLHFDQRPKLETYDDYFFLVIQGFEVDWNHVDDAQALELHLFVGPDFVVSVHDRPIGALESLRERITKDGRMLQHGPDHLCYLIADVVIDSYFPLLDEMLLRLDDLEDRVLDGRGGATLGEILEMKRLLIDLRRILSPQRDVLAQLARRGDDLVAEKVSIYFRDVHDHALRLHESFESARELVGNVRDAYLWNASQRTNEIMKRLTVINAIFLPLAFITGFFGQNFDALPFHSLGLIYLMLAACVVVPVGMLGYFIRSHWF